MESLVFARFLFAVEVNTFAQTLLAAAPARRQPLC
jgi:hypothetical protein